DGQNPFYGACTCGISIHSKLSPDSPAVNGEKVARIENFANRERCRREQTFRAAGFSPFTGEKVPAGG
ncbi:hypothetical protein, partial [Mesorhizobium sp. M1322]|uniref:hypothetical protein n=1 Tax=Mesorhizobium sp. M1322 TaxID=2957081 RepID=UPI00333C3964